MKNFSISGYLYLDIPRHSCATTLLQLTGNDIKKVQSIMGQSKSESKLLMSIYAHKFTKSNKAITDFWNSQFNQNNEKIE